MKNKPNRSQILTREYMNGFHHGAFRNSPVPASPREVLDFMKKELRDAQRNHHVQMVMFRRTHKLNSAHSGPGIYMCYAPSCRRVTLLIAPKKYEEATRRLLETP